MKNMKRLKKMKELNKFILLSLFLQVSVLNSKAQDIDSIKVFYVDFDIETSFSITPQMFDFSWLKDATFFTIKEKEEIDFIQNELCKQEKFWEFSPHLDTRCKMIFYYASCCKSVDIFYLDRFFVLRNDHYYKISDEIRSFLNKKAKAVIKD